MIGLKDQSLSLTKALSLFLLTSLLGLGCFGHNIRSDVEQKINTEQKVDESRAHSLYIHERSEERR